MCQLDRSDDEIGPHAAISPREKIWKASMAAATEERKWEGRKIIGWSEWVGRDNHKHAVMVLDDGARYVIHEEGMVL
jgi:hypothetical protein